MPTLITNPSAGDLSPVDKFHVVEGGTGGNTVETALQNLNGIPSEMYAQVNGPVPLNEDRKIAKEYLSDFNPNAISVNGPSIVRCGTVSPYQIVGFDSYVEIGVQCEVGSVYMVDDHAFYTPPDDAGPCGFFINDRFVSITAIEGLIRKPMIISPGENFSPSDMVLVIQGSIFECVDTGPIYETFSSADCEISPTPEFTELTRAIYNNPNTTFTFNLFQSSVATYVRIRYHGTERSSDWSDPLLLNPALVYVEAPTIISPVANSTAGAPNPYDIYRSIVSLDISISPYHPVNMLETFTSLDVDISKTSDFSNIVASVSANNSSDTSWTATNLNYGTVYYIRARHRSTGHISEWSTAVQFTTVPDLRYIEKPVISNAVIDTTQSSLAYDLTASVALAVGYSGYPLSMNLQGSVDPNFQNISNDLDAPVGEITFNPEYYNTPYYVRLRYYDAIKTSLWSDAFLITTPSDDRVIVTPAVTFPSTDMTGVALTSTLTSNAFDTDSTQVTFSDTHVSTDWELSRTADFSDLALSSYNDTVNKTSWTPSILDYNTTYYTRCRYHGALKTSNWSAASMFSTQVTFLSTVIYRSIQDIIKPAGVTQMHVELVGGGATGSNRSSYSGLYLGGAGQYVDSGWLDVSSAELTYHVAPGASGYDADFAWSDGDNGDPSTFSGNGLNYTATGGTKLFLNREIGPGQTLPNIPINSTFPYPWEGAILYPYTRSETFDPTNFTTVDPFAPGTYGRGGISYSDQNWQGTYYANQGAVAVTFDIEDAPNRPVVSVTGGTSNVSVSPTFTTSAFAQPDRFPSHVSTDWEIAIDSTFTNVVASSLNDTVNKTSWTASGLSLGGMYFIRAKHRSRYSASEWSTAIQFQVIATATGAYLEILGAGGGGGGGGGRNPGPDTYGNGAGGGGAGYRFTKTDFTILPGQVYNVVVGSGGLKGNGGGVGANGTAGSDGGVSSLDSYTANAGKGGGAGTRGPNYSGLEGIPDTYPGTGGVGSPNGAAGGLAPYNNSVGGAGGAGGVNSYGNNGGGGGAGGYSGIAGVNGNNGSVILEYASTLPQLVTSGATYSLVNSKHRYVWSVAGSYQFTFSELISQTYYAHDTGVVNTSSSTQYFKIKKIGNSIYYALSNAMTWVMWVGAVSDWSTLTYGTLWRAQGEAIRISNIQVINSTTIRVTVQFYDANIGGYTSPRWTTDIDVTV